MSDAEAQAPEPSERSYPWRGGISADAIRELERFSRECYESAHPEDRANG